ncbi:hypothetical protein K474DRAFT_1706431 [Panus rudis PR-1116 ss-1]|nr:hypothetical protein K474DRAFT_1706431 [Panus rudis PR-1116 ss-1]
MFEFIPFLFAHQHKIFQFSVQICGEHARLLRWDKSGCIFTSSFHLDKDPQILSEFLWRFSKLTPAQRGFDCSVENATEEEEDTFEIALKKFEHDCTRDLDYFHELKTRQDRFPVYKVHVEDNKGTHMKLLVKRPLYADTSDFGRSTRAYPAYYISKKRWVFLKDYWHPVNKPNTEARIYDRLYDNNVSSLPVTLFAGEVKSSGSTLHRTMTSEYASCACLRSRDPALVHYRIVQEFLYPLKAVINSKELVRAMRDAVSCITDAHRIGRGIHHRDLSYNNIMLSPQGHGILGDWDQAEIVGQKNANSGRVGTWACMSIKLLQDPHGEHDISDDLESCFWVLVHTALHYFPHKRAHKGRVVFPDFDEFTETHCDLHNKQHKYGGKSKLAFLQSPNGLATFTWDCVPLDTLIHDVAQIVLQYNAGLNQGKVRTSVSHKEAREFLSNPTNLLNRFNKALASRGWPSEDKVDNLYPQGFQSTSSSDQENSNTQSDDEEQPSEDETQTEVSDQDATSPPDTEALVKQMHSMKITAEEGPTSNVRRSARIAMKLSDGDGVDVSAGSRKSGRKKGINTVGGKHETAPRARGRPRWAVGSSVR